MKAHIYIYTLINNKVIKVNNIFKRKSICVFLSMGSINKLIELTMIVKLSMIDSQSV